MVASVAGAFDLPPIQLHGFLSQGYLKTTGNDFLGRTLDGSTQFNEIGLTVTTELDSHLRVGLQLLSRDLGDVGNNDVRLDWAFADYRWRDEIGIRIGKIKLPIGLYNEGRDSDFLRAMVFLPQSVYDENTRDIAIAAQGGGLYGHLSFGDAGGLDYEAVGGQNNVAADSVPMRWDAALAEGFAEQVYGPGTTILASHPENHHVVAGSLVYSTPIEGLRVGLSGLDARIDIDYDLSNGLRQTGKLRLSPMWVGSVAYQSPSFEVSAEYVRVDIKGDVFGLHDIVYPSEGWYGLVTWHATDRWHLSALYDIYYENRNDRSGHEFEVDANPYSQDFWGWRRDLGVGVRFDVDESWLVKVEAHDLQGAARFLPVFQPPNSYLDENWSLFAVKASFSF